MFKILKEFQPKAQPTFFLYLFIYFYFITSIPLLLGSIILYFIDILYIIILVGSKSFKGKV
jgi:hypothetical protein